MTIVTTVQPRFVVDSESERSTEWPQFSLTYCKDTQKAYILHGTSFVGLQGAPGATSWGDISGALPSQTDLNNALNAKAPLASPSLTGAVGIASNLNFAQVSALTTAGDVWSDSTQKVLCDYIQSIKRFSSSAIFSQTTIKTVGNTNVETTLTNTGVGTLTLPANYLVAGKTLRIRASGYITSLASSPGAQTWRLKLGGVTLLTATGTVTVGTTARGWDIDAVVTCYTTGSGGTVWAQSSALHIHTSATAHTALEARASATSAANTTGTLALDLTLQWATANASNTATCTNLIVETLA
jgi:hypothetical protein